ncbi:MAG: hypothetical protein JWP64_404, partial [Pseudonocardia sp.]|nr:hypothetical protein [Pseudonocardia sp.]
DPAVRVCPRTRAAGHRSHRARLRRERASPARRIRPASRDGCAQEEPAGRQGCAARVVLRAAGPADRRVGRRHRACVAVRSRDAVPGPPACGAAGRRHGGGRPAATGRAVGQGGRAVQGRRAERGRRAVQGRPAGAPVRRSGRRAAARGPGARRRPGPVGPRGPGPSCGGRRRTRPRRGSRPVRRVSATDRDPGLRSRGPGCRGWRAGRWSGACRRRGNRTAGTRGDRIRTGEIPARGSGERTGRSQGGAAATGGAAGTRGPRGTARGAVRLRSRWATPCQASGTIRGPREVAVRPQVGGGVRRVTTGSRRRDPGENTERHRGGSVPLLVGHERGCRRSHREGLRRGVHRPVLVHEVLPSPGDSRR